MLSGDRITLRTVHESDLVSALLGIGWLAAISP